MTSKLKYKGSSEKNEVWIDVMRLDKTVSEHHVSVLLERWFGRIPKTLPGGVLKVRFHIYKKKLSWIECNGKMIEFVYDIVVRKKAMIESDSFSKLHYLLSFQIKQKITRGLNLYYVNVADSCYPKKTLIKYLLNELVK